MVFNPHLRRLVVLSLHEEARSGVIRGDLCVVFPSRFVGMKIDGDDVCVSSAMKMLLRRRRYLLVMVVS